MQRVKRAGGPTGTTQGSRPCTARKRVQPWPSRDGFREHRPWRVATGARRPPLSVSASLEEAVAESVRNQSAPHRTTNTFTVRAIEALSLSSPSWLSAPAACAALRRMARDAPAARAAPEFIRGQTRRPRTHAAHSLSSLARPLAMWRARSAITPVCETQCEAARCRAAAVFARCRAEAVVVWK